MKKLVILLSLLIAITSFSEGFRGVEWGSGLKTIKKTEKGKKLNLESRNEEYKSREKKYEWKKDFYSFKDRLKSAGEFDVSYILLKGKLIEGKYSQKINKKNLKNYKKVKRLLKEKYGDPSSFYETSSFNSYNGKIKRERKVVVGWFSDDTKIELANINDEIFEINYYTLDKDLLDFIKESGLEKERAREKEILKDKDEIMKLL